MKSGLRGFILGVITACALLGATGAYAAGGSQIEVYFQKLKYMFDGVEKKPATEQGFIYNGTTYVPLRFVSESLGKEVNWDGTTQTVWVGKKPNTPSNTDNANNNSTPGTAEGNQYLTDLSGMTKEDEASSINVNAWGATHNTAVHKPAFRIGGTDYKKGLGLYHHDRPYPPNIKVGGTVQYTLNGKFTKLTAKLGADDSSLQNTAKGTVKFIGDGKELLVVNGISAGEAAKLVDLDITGVKVLRINFNSDRNGLINLIVADPMVTPATNTTVSNSQAAGSVLSDMIIVERDKTAEYVVLKNRGKQEIDLKGWKVTSVNGGQTYTFEQSFKLGPDSYVMLLSGSEGENFKRTGIDSTGFRQYSRSLLWSTSDIWNNDAGDAAELYSPSGARVSIYDN